MPQPGDPCLVQVVAEAAQLAAALDGEGGLGGLADRVGAHHHGQHVGCGACRCTSVESQAGQSPVPESPVASSLGSPPPGDQLSGWPPSPTLHRVPSPVSHGSLRLLQTWGAVHSEGLGSGRNGVAGRRVEHMLGRFLWKVVAWDGLGGRMWVLEGKNNPTDQNRCLALVNSRRTPDVAGVGPLGPSERQPWFCKGCPG